MRSNRGPFDRSRRPGDHRVERGRPGPRRVGQTGQGLAEKAQLHHPPRDDLQRRQQPVPGRRGGRRRDADRRPRRPEHTQERDRVPGQGRLPDRSSGSASEIEYYRIADSATTVHRPGLTVGDEIFAINETVSTSFGRSFLDTSLKFYLVHRPRLDLGLFVGANIHFVKLTMDAEPSGRSVVNESLVSRPRHRRDLQLFARTAVVPLRQGRVLLLQAQRVEPKSRFGPVRHQHGLLHLEVAGGRRDL